MFRLRRQTGATKPTCKYVKKNLPIHGLDQRPLRSHRTQQHPSALLWNRMLVKVKTNIESTLEVLLIVRPSVCVLCLCLWRLASLVRQTRAPDAFRTTRYSSVDYIYINMYIYLCSNLQHLLQNTEGWDIIATVVGTEQKTTTKGTKNNER